MLDTSKTSAACAGLKEHILALWIRPPERNEPRDFHKV
jgi:hypothetical protein